MIDRKSFCFDIHHTVSIKFYNQQIKLGPCCLADHVDLEFNNHIQEIANHDFLVTLRQENLENQTIPYACRTCKDLETSGLDSRRSHHLKFYSDDELTKPGIRMLDIFLPNLCNLKCVICGPNSSTSWIPDAEALGLQILPQWRYKKSIRNDIKNLIIPDSVEIIKFWGGEPLIDSTHIDILELAQKNNILKNQRVIYNTNGTVKVDDATLTLWKQCKLLELYFSIDDLGPRSDYQRTGSDWNQLQENLIWYRENLPDNHLMYICCSYSWLNIWNLPRVVDWHKEYFSNTRFGDKIQLIFNPVIGSCAIDKVSSAVHEELKTRFQNYPNLMELLNSFVVESNYRPESFIDYINKLDQIRGTKYSSIFEEHKLILQ